MRTLSLGILCVALLGCGQGLGPPHARPLPAPDGKPALVGDPTPRSPRIASYRLEASLDATVRRITATETLTWVNTGGSSVDRLPFHLYLNAFKNESSTFMQESRGTHRGAHASTTGWGWIDVSSIQIAGVELRGNAKFAGADETVLEVPLATPVAPGATIEVTLTFTSQLPEVFARTGYKDAFLMVGQWFPKIGVRVGAPGSERWYCETFHLATEFFADFGVYDVTLRVPKTHMVAATGVLVGAEDHDDGTRTLRYRAEDVHDFAWMADPYMEMIHATAHVDGHDVEVRVYYRPAQREFARRHLAAGVGAIEQFSALFVPYPWSIMSIVDPPPEAADGAGGMEYPTLVTAQGDSVFARPGMRLPEYVTIHEIGHNWFQGLLASNEAEEAWMDEGINDWADGQVIAKLYGERAGLIEWMGWNGEYYRLLRAAVGGELGDLPSPIQTAAYAFVDFDAYAIGTYMKTSMALRTLENLVGHDAFLAAVQRYTRDWQFKHPTGRDFFASLSTALDRDLSWFVGPAFQGTSVPSLKVHSSDCQPKRAARGVFGDGEARRTITETPSDGGWSCEVVIVDSGTVPVPVDIELRFADGSTMREHWDHRDSGHWQRFRFDRSSKLAAVVIDPDGQILLEDDPLDDHVRLEPDARAAWRASGRIQFWTHSTMQVFGL